jgi:hypothetical protein
MKKNDANEILNLLNLESPEFRKSLYESFSEIVNLQEGGITSLRYGAGYENKGRNKIGEILNSVFLDFAKKHLPWCMRIHFDQNLNVHIHRNHNRNCRAVLVYSFNKIYSSLDREFCPKELKQNSCLNRVGCHLNQVGRQREVYVEIIHNVKTKKIKIEYIGISQDTAWRKKGKERSQAKIKNKETKVICQKTDELKAKNIEKMLIAICFIAKNLDSFSGCFTDDEKKNLRAIEKYTDLNNKEHYKEESAAGIVKDMNNPETMEIFKTCVNLLMKEISCIRKAKHNDLSTLNSCILTDRKKEELDAETISLIKKSNSTLNEESLGGLYLSTMKGLSNFVKMAGTSFVHFFKKSKETRQNEIMKTNQKRHKAHKQARSKITI